MQNWGLIHADLHEGNYLFHNEQIRPIDFYRCGFGYYLLLFMPLILMNMNGFPILFNI